MIYYLFILDKRAINEQYQHITKMSERHSSVDCPSACMCGLCVVCVQKIFVCVKPNSVHAFEMQEKFVSVSVLVEVYVFTWVLECACKRCLLWTDPEPLVRRRFTNVYMLKLINRLIIKISWISPVDLLHAAPQCAPHISLEQTPELQFRKGSADTFLSVENPMQHLFVWFLCLNHWAHSSAVVHIWWVATKRCFTGLFCWSQGKTWSRSK